MHWILSGDIKKWIKYAPYDDLRTVAKIESKKGKKGETTANGGGSTLT